MGIASTIKKVMFKQTEPIVYLKERGDFFGHLSVRLNTLFSESEDDFLTVGSRLQDFSERSRELTEMTLSATRLTSGQEIVTAIEGLRGQMDQMTQYLDSSQEASSNGIKKLLNILDVNNDLDCICNSFKRIAQTLQFLGVSTRIESTQLGGRTGIEFKTLIDDVDTLAKLIDTKTVSILDNSKSLTTLIQKIINRSKKLLKTQQSSSVNILKDARSNLESLINLNGKSSRVSAQLAERSSEIYQNIGEVVTSMQFHDITRQQIEHVGKAMEDIQRKTMERRKDNGAISRNQQMDLICWVSELCQLQLSQLPYARDEFVNAVNHMIENLKGIATNITTMINELLDINSSTNQSDTSFLSRIEEGITTIIKSLNEDNKIGKEISTSVTETVNSMTVFVNDIEEISAKIEMIALNAQVKAANAGEQGRTLCVTAEAIQQLSLDTRSQSAAMLNKLRIITADTETLHDGSNYSSDNNGNNIENMVSNLKDMLGTIRHVNLDFSSLLNSINKNGQALGKEIKVVANQIEFHIEVSQSIDDIMAILESILKQLQKLVPSSTVFRKTEELEALKARYTTQKELEVHQAVIPIRTLPLAGKDAGKSDNNVQGHDLGDNIEFF